MKVKIIALGKQDAFYDSLFRSELIGATGEFESSMIHKGGFRAGDFKIDTECKKQLSGNVITFYRVKVHKL